jgi:hypothetical protein
MSSNTVNQVPYLRTSRDFPQEAQPLSLELNKAYIDIANSVNARTIGLFPSSNAGITGEAWFVAGSNQKQQSLRRVYPFTASMLIFPHQINLSEISGFVRIFGTFVDSGGSWYPLAYVDVVAASNQVNLIVNTTNIVITLGGGSPPSLMRGYVVLEWLANP